MSRIEEAAIIGQLEFGYVDWDAELPNTKKRWFEVMEKVCQLYEPQPKGIMDIREDKLLQTVTDELGKHFHDPIEDPCPYCFAAKAVIPLVLRAISKEATKLDHTTYSVPDYGKFKALWEEFVSGKEGG